MLAYALFISEAYLVGYLFADNRKNRWISVSHTKSVKVWNLACNLKSRLQMARKDCSSKASLTLQDYNRCILWHWLLPLGVSLMVKWSDQSDQVISELQPSLLNYTDQMLARSSHCWGDYCHANPISGEHSREPTTKRLAPFYNLKTGGSAARLNISGLA